MILTFGNFFINSISDGFQDFIADNSDLVNSEDYNLLSIIGTQSGGKSTILNEMFRTDFVQRVKGKSQQTTKGIRFALVEKAPPLIVFDTEGSDSKERSKDSEDISKKIALFSLMLSDVIIINVGYTVTIL